MKELTLRPNPYVGLRPFFEGDSLYFFGRGQQTAELLEILHQQRFLGIVGSSGSGKSSLVRAGLLPKLLAGFLAHDRDRWRIVRTRPGDAPLANLARALLDSPGQPPTPEAPRLLEEQIRDDHTDAVIELLQARVEGHANVFVLVDQFEEIFAFRGSPADEASTSADSARSKERARRKAEASDYVDLLLELAHRRELPIYVALAMRTDFLGECDLFYGLPEALNRGRYLVPRLTRQQLREAMEGPAVLVGQRIEARLLDYLLNELGDRFDRLPVLQHALQRTWDVWRQSGGVGSIDFPHYEAAGGLARALDRDAEEALQGLDPSATAAIFKRLTDTDLRQRRVRSPARVSELMASAGADRATVEGVARRFEENGRSFLYTTDDGKPDDPRVDISHESLIRQWDRLRLWVDEERRSRDQYRELAARARKREQGAAALLQDPELRVVTDWWNQARPSSRWAERYSQADGDFECASSYLGASVTERCHTLAEAELTRRWKIWNPLILVAVMSVAVLSEDWVARRPAGASPGTLDARGNLASRVESERGDAAIKAQTTRVGELDWTIDDRRRALDWQSAFNYCDGLTMGSRSDWRLPSTGELLEIYDPAAVTPAGLKLKTPFHDGVSSQWVWSGELGVDEKTAVAADFKGGMFVDLPLDFAGGVPALCVASPLPEGKAAIFDSLTDGALELIRRALPLGVFVLAYVVFAWLGKRLHRRLAFPRILQSFVASHGRNPDEAQGEAAEKRDAVDVHQTTYASTVRRVAGYWIDTALYLVCVILVFFVFAIATAEPGPRFEVVGGIPVAATLPSGAHVEGRSFDKLRVVVTLPSGEPIEGTLDQVADDRVSLTTDDGAHRSFALDPNTPKGEMDAPPSDADLLWFLAFLIVFGWLYEAVQLSSTRQATVGMRVAGVFRTGLHGERLSFGRASGWYGYRLLSTLAYGLGFASQPFTKRRQTFHDWMAGSVVLRRPKQKAASS